MHWKWSLIGERNWTATANKGGVISLDKTSPLNDPEMKGSCNVWEVDLSVENTGAGVSWQTRLHGSNGVTAQDRGIATGTMGNLRIDADHDAVLGLPATLSLAHVGSQQIQWRIAQ